MLHYSDKEHQALRHLERQIDREVDSIGPFDIFHRLAVAHELTYARLRELRFCFDQSVTLAYCDLCVAFESIDLRAMLPAILSIVREMLLIYAVSITAGAVVGGMFTGGIATAAGAAAGMEIATLVLTAMGLTCVAETFVKAIAHLTSDYSVGILDTWSAVRYDEYGEQVVIDEGKLRRAKHTLASAHTKLVIALLTAIALYISKGQLKVLTAEVRTGRLGERFAGWLEHNAGKLEQHPLLRPQTSRPAQPLVNKLEPRDLTRKRAKEPEPMIGVAGANIDERIFGANADGQADVSLPVESTNGTLSTSTVTGAQWNESLLAKYGSDNVFWDWPKNKGFVYGADKIGSLEPGQLIGRLGSERGTFASPLGSMPETLSLRPGTDLSNLNVYRVSKEITGTRIGPAAPAFDMPGYGTQYELPGSVKDLLKSGHLERVTQ